jgi:hypothetical protein
MTAPTIRTVPVYPVTIYMAGDIERAREVCRRYCDGVGLCVTLTATEYIYTNGQESGFVVGLINYARFPSEAVEIEAKAETLADQLREWLGQESYTIQTATRSTWHSWRVAHD